MNNQKPKFNILVQAEKFVNYIVDITDGCPKRLRSDLVPRMREHVFTIYENIIRANAVWSDPPTEEVLKTRIRYQNDALVCIRIVQAYLEVCKKHNYITKKSFAEAAKLSAILNSMIITWRASDKKRYDTLGV